MGLRPDWRRLQWTAPSRGLLPHSRQTVGKSVGPIRQTSPNPRHSCASASGAMSQPPRLDDLACARGRTGRDARSQRGCCPQEAASGGGVIRMAWHLEVSHDPSRSGWHAGIILAGAPTIDRLSSRREGCSKWRYEGCTVLGAPGRSPRRSTGQASPQFNWRTRPFARRFRW